MSSDKKILIIDDDGQFRKILTRYLNDSGYSRVTFAATGEEGVLKARTEKPDLIIIDTLLPGDDGFSVCERIKKEEKIKAKVIMTTGHIDAVDAHRARNAGADDYVVKTSDLSHLVQAVRHVL